MKIIFLDIDGVLNSRKYFVETHKGNLVCHKVYDYTKEEDLSKLQMLKIDFYKLQLLKEIIRETDAKIVITSAWRNLKEWPFIEEILIQKGLPIIGVTSSFDSRGNEIRDYLRNHDEIDNFIIIDDDIFWDFFELENSLVKTNYDYGLTCEQVYEAIDMLNCKKVKKYTKSNY